MVKHLFLHLDRNHSSVKSSEKAILKIRKAIKADRRNQMALEFFDIGIFLALNARKKLILKIRIATITEAKNLERKVHPNALS